MGDRLHVLGVVVICKGMVASPHAWAVAGKHKHKAYSNQQPH